MVAGTPLGGLMARWWGITGPMWFGFAGSAVLLLVLWREFGHIVHSSEHPAAD
jgi:predicted MFS family arabinose efflux permease